MVSFCRPPWERVAIPWSEVSEMGYVAGGGMRQTWVPLGLIRNRIGSYPQAIGNGGERSHGETESGSLIVKAPL